VLRTGCVRDYNNRMLTASSRVLRLLSLLQSRREWSGEELSSRLEVDVRTIRRDVGRLRELGYGIEASAGPGGGYRLGAGASTPPLLLDDEEAVAVGLALTAAAASIAGNSDAALRALVKLDQLLPARLRRKWKALHQVTLSLSPGNALVDPKVLTLLATACRDQVRVQFKYQDRLQQLTNREVEPMRLVHTGRVWYLVAWDNHRSDWRTFRVDRIDSKADVKLLNPFVPREPPGGFAAYVARSIAAIPYRYQAQIRLRESLESAKKRITSWMGSLTPEGVHSCVLTVSADSHEALAAMIVQAGGDFELLSPKELAGPISDIAQKLLRGVRTRRSKGTRGEKGGVSACKR